MLAFRFIILAPMAVLSLGFYGSRVRLLAGSQAELEPLRRDFEWFLDGEEASAAPVELRLSAGAAPAGFPEPPSRGRYRAFDRGGERLIRYDDGAAARFDFAAGEGDIHAGSPERLHELAYLAVLSRAGEALDRRGLHRVHALGFRHGDGAGLLLLPSGGGKSVLALELLRRGVMGFFSDDTPLLSPGPALRAFPLRWSFRPDADLSDVPAERIRPFARREHGPKRLVDLGHFRHRVAREAPLRWIVLGRPGGARAAWRPASSAAILAALSRDLVVGAGVAQMREYMLRPRAAPALAAIAWARARAALSAASGARAFELALGPDPASAADALSALVEKA